jgi:hypothetical protein
MVTAAAGGATVKFSRTLIGGAAPNDGLAGDWPRSHDC